MPKKILVVDDNKETVHSLNFALEKNGYEVIYAYDGQEGYLMATETKPDLILLDIMMPVMDGYTMNRHLKENPITKDIPVVIITAKKGAHPLFGPEEETHVTAILTKPFAFKDLLAKIQEVFSGATA
jgi:CheY-like chemotaxis protein